MGGRSKQTRLGRARTKRGRKRDKETEEESNHLKGLKVSVRLTHSLSCGKAECEGLAPAVCAGMKDEHNVRADLKG